MHKPLVNYPIFQVQIKILFSRLLTKKKFKRSKGYLESKVKEKKLFICSKYVGTRNIGCPWAFESTYEWKKKVYCRLRFINKLFTFLSPSRLLQKRSCGVANLFLINDKWQFNKKKQMNAQTNACMNETNHICSHSL